MTCNARWEDDPLDENEDAAAWAPIARHLATFEVCVVPAEFRARVARRLAREKVRRDLMLGLRVGLGTGAILICIAALALGVNWWSIAAGMWHSGTFPALFESVLARLASTVQISATVFASTRPVWPFFPPAMLVTALLAALAQFTLFRMLRGDCRSAHLYLAKSNP